MTGNPLKILFLSAEAVPFAKVGGLADVAGSLPQALRALGHDVRLMIPRYGVIRSAEFKLKKIGDPYQVNVGQGQEHFHVVGSQLEPDLPVYLLWNDQFFSSRDGVYGFEDDAQRFVAFSKAALGALKQIDWQPDIIHANDWHTGFVPTWLGTIGQQDPYFKDIATLFTIHNLAYQGITGRLILTFAQMEDLKHLPIEQPGNVNWMAQGIAHADMVSTVSEQYAQEILTDDIGMGLAPLLRQRKDQLAGVLNGLDYTQWNPATDPHIAHRFDLEHLNVRAANKTALQQQARLPADSKIPVIGLISRLDQVKGIDLLLPVLERLLTRENAQFILLGTGAPEYHEMMKKLQEIFPNKMHAFLKFDAALAQRIYAGTDMFLMPSKIEPCGLGQMIAMHYGSVPIVRATGGLADTVIDFTASRSRGNGFVFENFSTRACLGAIGRALRAYADKKTWRKIQERGMQADFSWSASAQKYNDLYRQTIAAHNA